MNENIKIGLIVLCALFIYDLLKWVFARIKG